MAKDKSKKKKHKARNIQEWIDTKSGQTFLQYAYSWGASIVILGALFKLTHITGADIMLFVGMGTEVIVFFISGFERPWDKEIVNDDLEDAAATMDEHGNVNGDEEEEDIQEVQEVSGVQDTPDIPAITEIPHTAQPAVGIDPSLLAGQVANAPIFNPAMFTGMTPEMEEATNAYVEQLNALTETLKQVAEQSARLTRDSEEMETMNRTLTGINRFYEMQLRSVGTQSATIDEVNEQTKILANKLQELNAVYARMVDALNMKIGN